jgi:ribonuclease BN (tRNA processing enzyme)
MACVANCSKGRYRLLLLDIRCFPTAVILGLTILSAAAVAHSGQTAQQSSGTEILFLGTTGGPPLHEDRSEPSTVLIVDGREYLIDCGIGTMRRMLQAGIQSEQIKTIFFTHLHPDHDLGLADVLANDFFRLRLNMAAAGQTIDIYGPPQTKELVDAAFRYISISFRPNAAENPPSYRMVNGEFASPFVTHEIEHEGVIFQDDKIRITAAENTHYALMSADLRQRMKSYSYRIETPHGSIVFTGDTGPSDVVAQLARGADVLVAEASYRDAVDLDRFVNSMAKQNHWPAGRIKAFRAHFQFEHLDSNAVGELASKAQVKSVLLYHYNPVDKADQAAYVNGVKNHFPGPVFASADLDRYCLGTSTDRQSPGARNLSRCAGPR